MARVHLHAAPLSSLLFCLALVPTKVSDRALEVIGALNSFVTVRPALRQVRPLLLVITIGTLNAVRMLLTGHALCVASAHIFLAEP